MKIQINVTRKSHTDDEGRTFETIEPRNYIQAGTYIRWATERSGYARVNIRPAGRAAAKQHGIL